MKQVLKAVICGTICAFTANAVDYTWDGGGGDSNWTTVANWDKSSGYPGTTAGLTDNAFVAAAEELHLDTNAIVKIRQIDFSPVPSRSLTVTGAAGAGFDTTFFTVGGTSILEFRPDIKPSGSCIKDGSGILDVPGNLTTLWTFFINAGTLRIASGNAVFSNKVIVGNASLGLQATLHLTDGGTMQWKSTILAAGPTPLVRLSGGTLQAKTATSQCNVPILIDGTNTVNTESGLYFSGGLSVTGEGHLIKIGASGLFIERGTENFVSGGLTISNSYVQFSVNTLYESYGGSTEPWHVRVCNGGRFFVGGHTAVFTVPLDLVMEPGGTVEFPGDFGPNYNVLVAHSIMTNGVSLPPGRYKAGSGFIKAGGLGSVVLATRWTGAGDGVSWFDTANWNGGVVPDGQNAVADISNAQGPVDLGSQDAMLTCLVYNPQGTQRAVTVTGSGTLSLHVPASGDGCLVVGPGRTLTLDVAIARASGSGSSLGVFGDGTVVVKKDFPAGVPCVSLMGNLVFDGTTEIWSEGEFMPMLGMIAATQPVKGAISNLFDATVTFSTNCRMSVSRIFSNPRNYYPVKQIIHDGAELVFTSKGYLLLTRYAETYMPPFTYFMRSGKLTLPGDSGYGISLGCLYTSSWEAARRGNAAFMMTGGEVTTTKFQLGTPEDVLTLQGGDIYLNSGGIVSLTNGFQGAVNLGGVAIHAAGNWGSSLNLTLTGAGGATVLDTDDKTVTLSGTLFGPGGLAKEGTGTLTLSGSNTFTGGVMVADGTLAANNGFVNATNLSVTASGAMLTLGSADSLSTNATLTVAEGGLLNLNFSGAATVNVLVVNGVAKSPGIYDSGKPFITGTGVLSVLNGPPPIGTILLIQ
ncbi:MAG: autotransporter-associated beta strand repeat-containing protein [Kiritimatiellia bacterium]